jgi:hypothetical protein
MYITLSLHTDISPEIVDLILDGKLEGGFSIDYALNALISFVDEKEVIIFSFDKYFKLDNRWSTYKIEEMGTKLVIILK